jgi:hypothetical protein
MIGLGQFRQFTPRLGFRDDLCAKLTIYAHLQPVSIFNHLQCAKLMCKIAVMIYGYARVSTDGQSVAAQVSALKAAGADKVFQEVASGAKTDRLQLRRTLDALDQGDVLMVVRDSAWAPDVDRAGRAGRI